MSCCTPSRRGRTPEETRALIAQMFKSNAATRSMFMQKQAADNPMFTEVVKRNSQATCLHSSRVSAPWAVGKNVDLAARRRAGGADSVKRKSAYADVGSTVCRCRMAIAGRDRLHQGLYVNSKTHLANFILSFLGDRMEMAHSIEGRVPFLDHHVGALRRARAHRDEDQGL